MIFMKYTNSQCSHCLHLLVPDCSTLCRLWRLARFVPLFLSCLSASGRTLEIPKKRNGFQCILSCIKKICKPVKSISKQGTLNKKTCDWAISIFLCQFELAEINVPIDFIFTIFKLNAPCCGVILEGVNRIFFQK